MVAKFWRTFFGPGWKQVEAAERRMDLIAVAGLLVFCGFIIGVSGCAMQPTDPVVVEKPVPVPCDAPEIAEPVWALDTVQLTGNVLADLVFLWRAAEAEIEQRRAYEAELVAAVEACR